MSHSSSSLTTHLTYSSMLPCLLRPYLSQALHPFGRVARVSRAAEYKAEINKEAFELLLSFSSFLGSLYMSY